MFFVLFVKIKKRGSEKGNEKQWTHRRKKTSLVHGWTDPVGRGSQWACGQFRPLIVWERTKSRKKKLKQRKKKEMNRSPTKFLAFVLYNLYIRCVNEIDTGRSPIFIFWVPQPCLQQRALYADCIRLKERQKKKEKKNEIAWENRRRPLMAQLRLLDECGIALR